jgi:DNA polymerase-1
MMNQERFLITDSNALIHRAYHALPPLRTSKGELVNSVYGFLLVFLKTVKDFQPSFVAAVFDLPFLTFRHQEFKKYKAQRVKAPQDLYSQIPKVKEALKFFNVPIFEKEGFEADDVIGTITKKISQTEKKNIESIIISGDLDNLQLVDEKTKVYVLSRGLKEAILYDREKIKERYGISPFQIIDFKALRGDSSDNIPGVPGIGEKTALKLIQEFGTLENLYQEIEKISRFNEKLREKLLKFKEQAFLSRKLVEIRRDLDIDFDLEKCRWGNYNREELVNFLEKLEFYSLLKRV